MAHPDSPTDPVPTAPSGTGGTGGRPRPLARPLDLRHLRLRNRIVFGAHTANMSEAGLPGAQHLAYYRERARGGAAMIVVEPVPVHPTAVLTRGNFRVDDDAVVPGFRAITEAVHAEGAAVLQQLYHVGAHGDFDNSYRAAWSPSGHPGHHDADGSHAMSEAEIEEVLDGFVGAAVRARACGFDGVEIFAAYHALVDQFWSPDSNRRTDRWGGTFEGRMRFSAEVLTRIRRAVGPEFVIGLATAVDQGTPTAMQVEELCEIVAWHDRRELLDYVTCGTGSYMNLGPLMPTFLYADSLGAAAAQALRGAVTVARVQAESHIRTPENADAVLGAGQADLVSVVRGQIADPHWVRKALAGHDDRVRGCISCNQMCWGRRSRDYWISCLVNPAAGREHEWGAEELAPAPRRRRVLVVGGGPAGLEVARVAAERGHRVRLAEAGPELGGAFRLAGLQPRRGQILDLIGWYTRSLDRLGVQVDRNRPLDGAEVLGLAADHVVLATGSEPAGLGTQRPLPGLEVLPGVERRDVMSVEAVMSRPGGCGHRVLLLDDLGDWRAAGTAWFLAERGHEVVVVTGWPMLGFWLQRTASDGALRARLAGLGVTWRTESAVVAWDGTAGQVRDLLTGAERSIAADTLVLATTNRPRRELADELAGLLPTGPGGPALHVVGDAEAARLAVHAIHDGRRAGLRL